jgi:hypothetical protein
LHGRFVLRPCAQPFLTRPEVIHPILWTNSARVTPLIRRKDLDDWIHIMSSPSSFDYKVDVSEEVKKPSSGTDYNPRIDLPIKGTNQGASPLLMRGKRDGERITRNDVTYTCTWNGVVWHR